MKARCCLAVLVTLTLVVPTRADDTPKEAGFKVLPRADLKKLEGVWGMKVKTEKGWTGTIRATITLYPAGSMQKDFGRILYDYDLVRGQEKMSIRNAPSGGIAFAGVTRGKKMLLVTAEREGFGPTVPFKVDPKEELSAPASTAGGKLRLDVSKSRKNFCSPLSSFDLEWGRLEFTRARKN